MEAKVIITTELQLKAFIADAVSAAFKYYQTPSPHYFQSSGRSKKIDFPTMMKEYYPGIPESTVRQATAHLSRTKVGKRRLFDREEIERDQEEKRQKSVKGFDEEADAEFINHHQRNQSKTRKNSHSK